MKSLTTNNQLNAFSTLVDSLHISIIYYYTVSETED